MLAYNIIRPIFRLCIVPVFGRCNNPEKNLKNAFKKSDEESTYHASLEKMTESLKINQ